MARTITTVSTDENGYVIHWDMINEVDHPQGFEELTGYFKDSDDEIDGVKVDASEGKLYIQMHDRNRDAAEYIDEIETMKRYGYRM